MLANYIKIYGTNSHIIIIQSNLGHGYDHHEYRSENGIILPHHQTNIQNTELPVAGRSYGVPQKVDAKEFAYLENLMKKNYGAEVVPLLRSPEDPIVDKMFSGLGGKVDISESTSSS